MIFVKGFMWNSAFDCREIQRGNVYKRKLSTNYIYSALHAYCKLLSSVCMFAATAQNFVEAQSENL